MIHPHDLDDLREAAHAAEVMAAAEAHRLATQGEGASAEGAQGSDDRRIRRDPKGRDA